MMMFFTSHPSLLLRILNKYYHLLQALQHARDQLRKLTEKSEKPPNSPKAVDSDSSDPLDHGGAASTSTTGSNTDGAKESINLLEVLEQAEVWLNRVELLQTLFGSYVPASLNDIIDDFAAEQLRERLIADERYNLAVFMCTKCKVHNNLPLGERTSISRSC